jgi:Dolichyl-phosphate-mannose-protein mannosyltransferase
MTDTVTEAKLGGERIPGIAEQASPFRSPWTSRWNKTIRWIARNDACDIATLVLIAALVAVALFTFKDYAISNDEGIQHRYGELIIAYYTSGFADQSVFNFQNLYLYGGLFDIAAVLLSHLFPIDPYDLRHILCALIGIGGIGAAAATARLIAGPRAALIAAVALSVTGAWYGTMFNHTKDIPFATAMIGATLFLIRIARRLPSPRAGDIAAFGLLAGAALGMRVLGLLLVVYVGFAIVLYLPKPYFPKPNFPKPNFPKLWLSHHTRWRFVVESSLRLLPALLLAYVIMILAWPWAALAPLNPIRGLLAFSEYQYPIRTLLAGQVYEMANTPRLYVPIYILIRLPLLMLFGAALAMVFALWPRLAVAAKPHRRDIALVSLTVFFPLACQVICHGPAFTGLRHFLFVIPALAVLAGIGLDAAATALATRGRLAASGGLAVVTACFVWNAVTLVRLHPYESLFYNAAVGGLEGASRRYDLDYWFNSMPEALHQLEAYLRRTEPGNAIMPARIYSVAVCGERLSFDKTVTLPQLHWDFKQEWNQSEFFIAPTQMNCDGDVDGKVIGTVERLGVPIAYVKDRRALIQPVATAKR